MEQADNNKRAHPRYAVSNLEFVKARLDRSSAEEKILTIGAGGCGFVGFDRSWRKADIKRVTSVFELNLPDRVGPITVQGNVVFIKPVTVNGRPMFYVGIQFLDEDAHRIRPVISALEELNKKGQVGLASA